MLITFEGEKRGQPELRDLFFRRAEIGRLCSLPPAQLRRLICRLFSAFPAANSDQIFPPAHEQSSPHQMVSPHRCRSAERDFRQHASVSTRHANDCTEKSLSSGCPLFLRKLLSTTTILIELNRARRFFRSLERLLTSRFSF